MDVLAGAKEKVFARGEDFSVWYIDQRTQNPLRNFFGRCSFYLLTDNADLDENQVKLHQLDHLDTGTLLSVPKNVFGILSDACSSEQVITADALIKPLHIDLARHILATCRELSVQEPIIAFCEFPTTNTGYLGLMNAGENGVYTFDIQSLDSIEFKADQTWLPEKRLLDLKQATSTEYEYHFEILPANILEGDSSTIVIATKWSGDGSIDTIFPLQPPLSSTVDFTIKCVHPKKDPENFPGLVALHRELTFLYNLNEVRNSTRPVGEWSGFAAETGASIRVLDFIKNTMDEGFSTSEEFDLGDGLPQRRDLDFTERLWDFACSTVSQEDLLQVMTAIVEELESETLQPMVSKQNRTQFANLVRECLKLAGSKSAPDYVEQKEAISSQFDFWLEDLSPKPSPILELIIELGIEKIKRDFAHWMLGQNLLTWNQMATFFDSESKTECIFRLRAFARIVEVWDLARRNIFCLPDDQKRTLVQKAHSYWHDLVVKKVRLDLEKTMVYRLPFPRYAAGTSKAIQSITASIQPTEMIVRAIAKEDVVLVHLSDEHRPGPIQNRWFHRSSLLETDGKVYFRVRRSYLCR